MAFTPDDLSVLQAHLDDSAVTHTQKAFSLGFCTAPNHYERRDVWVERFNFMGQSLAVLKLA